MEMITITHKGQDKTLAVPMWKYVRRTALPEFTAPFNKLLEQVYNEEISEEEYLEELLREFMTK